jgi:hypothetical protein
MGAALGRAMDKHEEIRQSTCDPKEGTMDAEMFYSDVKQYES